MSPPRATADRSKRQRGCLADGIMYGGKALIMHLKLDTSDAIG